MLQSMGQQEVVNRALSYARLHVIYNSNMLIVANNENYTLVGVDQFRIILATV
jgi:hypothetical protein